MSRGEEPSVQGAKPEHIPSSSGIRKHSLITGRRELGDPRHPTERVISKFLF
jgi:hypothetical protein